jgi:uncharacterized protein DUF1064
MVTPRASAAIARSLGLTKRQKFNARTVTIAGETFGSQKEAREYLALQWRERVGEITDLRAHPVFLLFGPYGQQLGKFTPDACFREGGELVAWEVKSAATRRLADYRLRVKLFRACYPTVRFVEV